MRKDVRFGLSVGGTLVLVLVVWVVLADHFGPKPLQELPVQPPPQQVADDTTTQPAAPATQPLLTELPPAATQPTQITTTSTPSRDWDSVLATGQMPVSTPTTQPIPLSATIDTPGGGEATPAAAIETPTTEPARTIARTHKVAEGETYYTIAASVYGDGSLYTKLEDANPNVDAKRLRIGTVLNVPDLSQSPSRTTAVTAETAVTPAPSNVDTSRSYKVQSSDTLISISRKLYGKGSVWQKIYDANRDVIGDNPARLKVGMVLRLPEAPTVATH